jgi:hypothetical protein
MRFTGYILVRGMSINAVICILLLNQVSELHFSMNGAGDIIFSWLAKALFKRPSAASCQTLTFSLSDHLMS